MNEEQIVALVRSASTVAIWNELLQDDVALLDNPGAHHKALVQGAHMLHRTHIVDRDGLSDLLEQADGALAYAVEALLDQPSDE
ncbi:hypothetical protein [Pseudomonas gingeri]|uniref:hypothetical protein n=1 Tax=Pseudomonas gingeri TaxID=117681 RepID=UPI00159FC0BB|nr:hypothetical protein [Pseudomonas gingeri]NWE26239.1 hypothetical protein [Pseudomonas gingeri]NWE95515.1 hypothetical protein [Pseudomonas gingeri]